MAENVLYYGDNLDVMRRHIKDESFDLVYLDPPFNSAQPSKPERSRPLTSVIWSEPLRAKRWPSVP